MRVLVEQMSHGQWTYTVIFSNSGTRVVSGKKITPILGTHGSPSYDEFYLVTDRVMTNVPYSQQYNKHLQLSLA